MPHSDNNRQMRGKGDKKRHTRHETKKQRKNNNRKMLSSSGLVLWLTLGRHNSSANGFTRFKSFFERFSRRTENVSTHALFLFATTTVKKVVGTGLILFVLLRGCGFMIIITIIINIVIIVLLFVYSPFINSAVSDSAGGGPFSYPTASNHQSGYELPSLPSAYLTIKVSVSVHH